MLNGSHHMHLCVGVSDALEVNRSNNNIDIT